MSRNVGIMKSILNALLLASTVVIISSASIGNSSRKAGVTIGKTGTGTGTLGEGMAGSGTGSTGSTGTGATGTGSTGTGSTGTGTGGGAPYQGLMRIERAEEWKSQTSYTTSGTLTNVHVARMILQVAGPPPNPPGQTTVYVNGQPVVVNWILDNYSYTVGGMPPAQMGAVISGSNLNPASGTFATPGGNVTGIKIALTAGGEIPLQISATGPFTPTSTQFLVTVDYVMNAHYIDPNTHQSVPEVQELRTYYTLNLLEMQQNGSAIDSRHAFGQPNLAGELPGDPNAPSRAVDFTHWIYQGGCFVGNNPVLYTTDESGLARMEFWGGGVGTGTCLAATATMLDMGARTTPTGAETVGVYIPDSSDYYPNDPGPGGLTWARLWTTINPTSQRGAPVDYANTPCSTLTLSATNTTDYLNWIIADTGGGGYVIPPAVFSHMCFALTNETTGPSWHYFGDASYQFVATTFPGTDCIPRIWWVGLNSSQTF